MNRIFVVLAAAAAFAAPPPARITSGDFSPERYLDDVKYLSAESMRGRGTGSPELEKAGKYIAQQFHKAGLQPAFGKSYYQAFTVSINSHLGSQNQLEYMSGSERHLLRLNQDFLPFNFSASGKVDGKVVFAGYGITAREYNYDDYANLDVKDKIVLVLRHEPQEFDAKSVFEGRVYTEHSQLFSKAANAKFHGAKAILFVNDVYSHAGNEEELDKFGTDVSPASPGIPFVQVKPAIAEKWFALAKKDMKSLTEGIDKDLQPRSFPFPDDLSLDLQTDVRRDVKTVHNVAGYLPGMTDEYVVIGAHYDHLGLGEQYSLAPSMAGTVHPGADDNASGTAGVIALARYFGSQPKRKRGVLFLAFAGEELGLLGSSFYVNHPKLPLGQAVTMINLDMIGRIRDEKVFVGGIATGSNFKSLFDDLKAKYPFHFDWSEQGGYGSSDHTSFTTKQVPVLFFFSGLHGDYHKPSDTWEKIVPDESVKLLQFIADVTERLEVAEVRPAYVRVEPQGAHGVAASAEGTGSSGGSGYGPYFGSIPDFAEVPVGVRFADVHDGSPAGKAGLKAGDILVQFDGKKIQNLYDFTYVLRSKKPGDEVEVEVLRNGQSVRAKVLLEKRK
jgi:hypothetical protein